ncbi:MAG TPA: glycosyltransferase [Bacteroidales bacterium]|nr:glycosyltransferase [Bacteroidales bacterium]
MPSVLIFCKTLLKGGAEKQALALSKLLVEKNISLVLISWCGSKIDTSNDKFIHDNSIKFIGLKGSPFKKFAILKKIIREENITLILAYLTKANLIAGVAKLFFKDLITVGGIRTEQFPFYKLLIEKYVHNHLNDMTVFNNYSGKNKFERRGFVPEKIFVIHNTIHIPEFKVNTEITDEIRLVSVCRFVKSKDFRTALYSFRQLVDNNQGVKLKYYIVGYGPLEEYIRNLVAKLDLHDEVQILIKPSNIPELLNSSDIYLSTSLYEGLSNSIMEAMVAGLPVVATNVGDNSYLIRDGYNGYIVPCWDIDMVVEKLNYLVQNESIRQEYGINSHSIIENDFSEEKFLGNYYDLFIKLNARDFSNSH